MRKTLRATAKEATFFYPKTPRMQWLYQYPGMITLLGSQIWWTWEVGVYNDVDGAKNRTEMCRLRTLSVKLEKVISMP